MSASSSTLSTLLRLGIPRLLAQRALAALGLRSTASKACSLLTDRIDDPVFMDEHNDLGRHFTLTLNSDPSLVLLHFDCLHEYIESLVKSVEEFFNDFESNEKWPQQLMSRIQSTGIEISNVRQVMEQVDHTVVSIRLYSQEIRSSENSNPTHSKAFKVCRRFRARDESELELSVDDQVLVDSDDWYDSGMTMVPATTVLSGRRGLVARSLLISIPIEQTWSLHVDVQLQKVVSTQRRLYVVRHGERLDRIFGSDWMHFCFDKHNNYLARDINLPSTIPMRSNLMDFSNDTPLTLMGERQATLLGSALSAANVKPKFVFASPSLRCVQTAQYIVDQMELEQPIRVEPGLFEWLEFYCGNTLGLPVWMSVEEMRSNGYSVDVNYKPFLSTDELANTLHNVGSESADNFYARNAFVVQCILQSTESSTNSEINNDVLLVGHSGSLDACTRDLVNGQARSESSMLSILRKVPYCGICAVEKKVDGEWELVEPPVPPLTHSNCARFDWRLLEEDV